MSEATTITPAPDGDGVTLHLPEFTRLDTQVWSVDIGLTQDGLDSLRDALNTLTDDETARVLRIADAAHDAKVHQLEAENARLRGELEHRKEEMQRAYTRLGWTYDGSDAGAVTPAARECTCGPVGDWRTEGPQQPDEDCPAHGNPAIITATPDVEAADAVLDQRIAEALTQPRPQRP